MMKHPKQNILLLSLLIGITTLFGCKLQKQGDSSTNANKKANALINESSPYLLQHAYNPVNWYPWGDQALEKAKSEGKPIIISIGYAACHWCHVMEHESFEDTTVARIMNDNFVSIKIDREERPDIDQVYMDAAYLINKRGGWPLNAIALPDGRPIFAGTYYPRNEWLDILNYFVEQYETNINELERQADNITNGIKQIELMPTKSEVSEFSMAMLDSSFKKWQPLIDFSLGGRSGAPKFPMPNNYDFLLHYHHATQNSKAIETTTTTLQEMAKGGIYDHLGGGFARYSTDSKWLVPHFEKMLYDNAQLVSLYSKAYQQNPDPLYKKVVAETLEYIRREMTDKTNGFYSSLDADSEGEEGKFYVWKKAEVDSLLGENSSLFCQYYNITKSGNWEHKNILHVTKDLVDVAKKFNITIEEARASVNKSKEILMEARSQRTRPGLDDKILTSWNALMLKGYVDAYRAFGKKTYLQAALANAQFIVTNCMKEDGRLSRNFKEGKASINAFLDDYGLTAEAFIALYQATFNEQWLLKAQTLTDYAIQHFYDDQSGMFFYTSDQDEALIARKMELSDNVISSSNSVMGHNLYLLGLYLYNKDYIAMAKQMASNIKADAISSGPFYANWLRLMLYLVNEPYEIAILGNDCQWLRQTFDENYLPNAIFLGGNTEGTLALLKNKLVTGRNTIYVCQQKVCKLPVSTVAEALDLMP